MKRPRWYVRPGDDVINPKTGRPYPGNHAVPRVAWHAQHAHTATEALVYDFLEKRGQVIGGGRRKRTISRAQLARELKMPESTVRNCLVSLIRKHSIAQWDEAAGRFARRTRGDFGGVTTWIVRSWAEALAMRRADPAVGTVNGNCYVIGKGRRFLSPFEISAWKVDAVVAERFSQTEKAPAAEIAANAGPPPGPAAPPTQMSGSSPPPGTEKRTGKPDFEPLKLAIIAACGEGSDKDVRKVWRHICREAGGRPPAPDVAAACEMVADVHATWRHLFGGKTLTPGLLATKVESRVRPWQQTQASRKHQEAKAAAFERERRINHLALYLNDLAVRDLPAADRALMEEVIASADPDELELARSLVAGGRTQAAG